MEDLEIKKIHTIFKGKILLYSIIGAFTILSLFTIILNIQNQTELDIKNNFLDNQKSNQLLLLNSMSANIGTDLHQILGSLNQVSENDDALLEKWNSPELQKILQDTLDEINLKSYADAVSIFDFNGVVVAHVSLTGETDIIGTNLAFRDYVKNTENTLSPYFSDGFIGINSDIRYIMLTNPIIDPQNGNYIGLTSALINSEKFFSSYGNIEDRSVHSVAIVDKSKRVLESAWNHHAGKFFSDDIIQQDIDYDAGLNQLINSVVDDGKTLQGTFALPVGEIIVSGSPIYVDDESVYFLWVITPTSLIYSEAESILFSDKLSIFSLLIVISAISAILGILLINAQKRKLVEKTIRLSTIGTLSSRIAHDLKTPLFIIKSTLQLLEIRKGKQIDYRDKEDFLRLNTAVDTMVNIIERVLDYARLRPIELQATSTTFLIEETLNSIIIPKEVTITKPTHDFKITCDSKQIQIVFSNLISNSIQSMNKKGYVTIRIKETEKDLIFEFEDSGPGIPDNVLAMIFDPLFTTKSSGTGLGLVSCKNIVSEHQGSISVKNNPTVFTVRLPKKQSDVEILPDILQQ